MGVGSCSRDANYDLQHLLLAARCFNRFDQVHIEGSSMIVERADVTVAIRIYSVLTVLIKFFWKSQYLGCKNYRQ